MKAKELDLQSKNPLFSFFAETIGGLTQIRILRQIVANIKEFSIRVNNSTKSTFAYDISSQGYAFYQTIATIILLFLGMILGVIFLQFINKDLYAVSVIYLIQVS